MKLPGLPNLGAANDERRLNLQLMYTIALEELALATLIFAEANKIQTMVDRCTPCRVTPQELIELNRGVAEVMREIIAKEDRLLRKLAMVSHPATPDTPPSPQGQPNTSRPKPSRSPR